MFSSCSWFGVFFFSSRRRHTRFDCDWSSDVCSSDLVVFANGKKIDLLDPSNNRSNGLIAFELNPGKYKVESKLQEALIEKVADGLSEIGRASCRERV